VGVKNNKTTKKNGKNGGQIGTASFGLYRYFAGDVTVH
jgi:hypothetical protein